MLIRTREPARSALRGPAAAQGPVVPTSAPSSPVLAINVRAASTADADLAASSYELLAMLTLQFGIPLSVIALATGAMLGLSSQWGVLRHAWVATKLVLLIGVLLVGALVLGPGTDAMPNGDGGAEARLIAGATYDVATLMLATGLSVFKPRRRRPARER